MVFLKTCALSRMHFLARLTSWPHSCHSSAINRSCVHQPGEPKDQAAPMSKAGFFLLLLQQQTEVCKQHILERHSKYDQKKKKGGKRKKKLIQMLSICRKQMLSSLTALWQTSNSIQKIQHSQSGLMTMLPDMSLCFSCTFHVFPHAVLLPIIYDWSAPSLPLSILFNLCNSDLQWLIINTKKRTCVLTSLEESKEEGKIFLQVVAEWLMSLLKKGKANQKQCSSSSLQQISQARRASSPACCLRRKGIQQKKVERKVAPYPSEIWRGWAAHCSPHGWMLPQDAHVCATCLLHHSPPGLLVPQHPLQNARAELAYY